MRTASALLFLLLVCACGKSGTDSTPTVARPPVITPPDVRPEEVSQIAELKPTMYYVPQEDLVKCEGRYRSVEYSGTETSAVLDPEGRVLATVCTRFLKTLDMEGTGILKDRGAGRITVNFAARVEGQIRYRAVGRCRYGEGVQRDLCLLPYHTIAADNKVHKINEIIFVPRAEGIQLPDGSLHEGYFIVRDTGGAFDGIGAQRVDLFTGLDPDNNNAFSRAGFNHNTPLEAFKVKGDSAEMIRKRLQARFSEIY